MVINCFTRIKCIVLMPDQIHQQLIGKHSLWMHYKPRLIPFQSHCCSNGIVPPPQAYSGTPIVAAINRPNPSFCSPKIPANVSAGTYLWKSAESKIPKKNPNPVAFILRIKFFRKRNSKFGSVSWFSGSSNPSKLKNDLFLYRKWINIPAEIPQIMQENSLTKNASFPSAVL